jgi:ketosteroid isomerase-like protein
MFAKVLCAALLAGVLVFSLTCSLEQEEQDDLQSFEQAVDDFYAAIEEGRDSARAEMFTDDALMLPNHWDYTRGKEDITQMITGSEGWIFKLKDVNHLDMGVSGDIGYTVNDYYYTWHPEGQEPQWHKTKNIHIWKRQADGIWKLHADLWNSSEPLASPEEQ